MKNRILSTVFFLSIATLSFASSHITFMGIEVTGQYSSFKDSLLSRGFTYIDSYETSYNFYGKFANEIVKLTVLSSPKSNTVCKVIVYFPEKSSWFDLKRDYFKKKELYMGKYPLETDFDFFSSPYDEGDGYEFRAVLKGKCRFASFFYALGGHIMVEIDESAQIKVTYEDRDNIKLAQEELNQKAVDDI